MNDLENKVATLTRQHSENRRLSFAMLYSNDDQQRRDGIQALAATAEPLIEAKRELKAFQEAQAAAKANASLARSIANELRGL